MNISQLVNALLNIPQHHTHLTLMYLRFAVTNLNTIWHMILTSSVIILYIYILTFSIKTSNKDVFCVTGPLWVESTGQRRIPLRGKGCGTSMFSLICAWTNGWANNRDAGDLRWHRAHYDVSVMLTETLLQRDVIKMSKNHSFKHSDCGHSLCELISGKNRQKSVWNVNNIQGLRASVMIWPITFEFRW